MRSYSWVLTEQKYTNVYIEKVPQTFSVSVAGKVHGVCTREDVVFADVVLASCSTGEMTDWFDLTCWLIYLTCWPRFSRRGILSWYIFSALSTSFCASQSSCCVLSLNLEPLSLSLTHTHTHTLSLSLSHSLSYSLALSFSFFRSVFNQLPTMTGVITECYLVHAAMVHFVNQIQVGADSPSSLSHSPFVAVLLWLRDCCYSFAVAWLLSVHSIYLSVCLSLSLSLCVSVSVSL